MSTDWQGMYYEAKAARDEARSKLAELEAELQRVRETARSTTEGHASLFEERERLGARISDLESERDRLKYARDHARKRCEEAWAEGGKLGRALQAARKALEDVTKTVTFSAALRIARRALAALDVGTPGAGTPPDDLEPIPPGPTVRFTLQQWATFCEHFGIPRDDASDFGEVVALGDREAATPAAPVCETCRGSRKLPLPPNVLARYGGPDPCPDCTTPTPTETPR